MPERRGKESSSGKVEREKKSEERGEETINTAGRTQLLDIVCMEDGGTCDGTGMLMLAARLV